MITHYEGREHPLGAQRYPLEDTHRRAAKNARHYCMLDEDEPHVVYDIPRMAGGGVYVNLGHARGGSAILMAKSLREHGLPGHVFSVDMLKESYSREVLEQYLTRQGVRDRVTIVRGTTKSALPEVEKHAPFSGLFIDADHSYEGVQWDFVNYGRHVKRHGIIAFHDTNQEFTHRVLRELVFDDPRWERVAWIQRIMVFRRIG